MKLYRFRSMDYLLGDEYQELEKETIYFASPDQLNDPMEGLRDIVWRGDEIVWEKFIKNYVDCLHGAYILPRMRGGPKELDVDNLPILGGWNNLTPEGQTLFDDVWYRVGTLPDIREIIEALANSSRDIRSRELRYYLRLLQFVILDIVRKLYIERRFMPRSAEYQPEDELRNAASLKKIVKTINRLEDETEEERNLTLQKLEAADKDQRLNQQRKHNSSSKVSSEIVQKNNQLVIYDFPIIYPEEFGRKLWPKWYPACFMESACNSSAWGHYGEGHRGVCLIFETVEVGGSNYLNLQPTPSGSFRLIPFFKVSYERKTDEIDVFRYIANLGNDDVIQLWFTDEKGKTSKCVDSCQSERDRSDWQKKYRDSFYRDIITKIKDWQDEQEWRLILDDLSAGFDVANNRTLRYDFNSLKGIIFGINTTDEDRLRIIEFFKEVQGK